MIDMVERIVACFVGLAFVFLVISDLIYEDRQQDQIIHHIERKQKSDD